MNDWTKVAAGGAGTLATVGLEHLNSWIALGCGVLTLVLLARRVFFAFRGDLRRVRAQRSELSDPPEKGPERGQDQPE